MKKSKLTTSLEASCQQAWDYMQQHPTSRLRGLSKRPWILMMGTKRAEKTSILKAANLPITSPTKEHLWWIADEVAFIDPTSSLDTDRWQHLLTSLQHLRHSQALHHVVYVIDFPTLANGSKGNQTSLAQTITRSLQDIQRIVPAITVTLIISHCDKILGFSEFFDDLTEQERKEAFGMTFTRKSLTPSLSTTFHNKYAALLAPIQSRVIPRLQRERRLEKRQRIHQFPVQMRYFGACIETLLEELPFNPHCLLTGIYFSCHCQQGEPIDLMNHLKKTPALITSNHAFFVKNVFQNLIQSAHKPLKMPPKRMSERLMALPIAAGLILGLTTLWHFGFNNTIKGLNQTQTVLATPASTLPSAMQWLHPLNQLSTVKDTLDNPSFLHFRWVGLTQAHTIYKLANKQYGHVLKTDFISYLKNTLLKEMALGLKHDKLALFDALKTYLSITSETHYDKNIIMGWYLTYWRARYPDNQELQGALQHHLFYVLQSSTPLWQKNVTLIKKSQDALKKLPLTNLAFFELQGEYNPIYQPIFPHTHIPGVSFKEARVPAFFSSDHFKIIYNKQIPEIGKILEKGSWVLGTKKGPIITKKQESVVAKKLQRMYLKYYASIWASTITHIKLTPQNSIEETHKLLQEIIQPNSSLMQHIKIIIGNADLDGGDTIQSNKSTLLVKQFIYDSKRRQALIKPLIALDLYLKKLMTSKSKERISYLSSAVRFNKNGGDDPISTLFHNAKSEPSPIKNWMLIIADSSWKAVLKNAKSYLNEIWKTLVLPVYANEIKGRYPIFSNSKENISLKNFNDYFGPNGTIGAFYIYYLQPFVNMKSNYWTLKRLNGATIGISRPALNMFIRASLIQQMFFTDNHNAPSFQFSMMPDQFSTDVKKTVINIGGQVFSVLPGHQKSQQFFWPGPDPSFASMSLLTSDNHHSITKKGPWALLRLMQASLLKTTANPMLFSVTFKFGKSSADFALSADHRVNPFVPGILAKYRCPKSL